jgi:hypothetical protein
MLGRLNSVMLVTHTYSQDHSTNSPPRTNASGIGMLHFFGTTSAIGTAPQGQAMLILQ